jgi:hypothetical protein
MLTQQITMQTPRDRIESLRSHDWRKAEYVLARIESPNKREALSKCDRGRGWYYKLPEDEKAELEKLVVDLRIDKAMSAYVVLCEASIDAVHVLIRLLQSKNPWVQLSAARTILDWTMEKPTRKQQVSVRSLPSGYQELIKKIYGEKTDQSQGNMD